MLGGIVVESPKQSDSNTQVVIRLYRRVWIMFVI